MKNKTSIGILTLILIISIAMQVRSTVDTGSYYLDTPLPIASYYVGKYSNNTYFAINGSNWDNFLRSTNASLVFNTCFDAGYSTVQVGTGIFTLDSPIIMSSCDILIGQGGDFNTTWDGYGTILRLGNGVDDSVIKFPNTIDHNRAVVIRDIAIDGNKAQQSAGHGIEANRAVRCRFVRILIRYVEEDGMRLGGSTLGYHNVVDSCKFMDCDGWGLRLVFTEENDIIGCYTGENGASEGGIYLTSNANTVLGGVCNQENRRGIQVEGMRNRIIGTTIDRPEQEAIVLSGADQTLIQGVLMFDISRSSNGTYDAIRMLSDSDYTQILNCEINKAGVSPKVPDDVVYSDGTSDYVRVRNNDFRYYDNLATNLNGLSNDVGNNWT